MNHSKAFWAVRNKYAEQMRVLWSRSYTGEGLWGRGASLSIGQFEQSTVRPDEQLPEHTCGGTFRSSRRKRRKGGKEQLSYQEQKAKRILKKFGPNGQSLGEDEDIKAELEKGRRTQAKPRVAGSQRGRDLRAAAALARFDQQAKASKEEEQKKKIKVEEIDSDATASGSDSDETASDNEEDQEPAAVDINGQKLVDEKGHNLVRVCEDENADDGDARNEMRELLQSTLPFRPSKSAGTNKKESESKSGISKPASAAAAPSKPAVSSKSRGLPERPGRKQSPQVVDLDSDPEDATVTTTAPQNAASRSTQDTTMCPLCSFANEDDSSICMVCSHVLDASRVPGAWKCKSAACQGSQYLNVGDSGVCGICGECKG